MRLLFVVFPEPGHFLPMVGVMQHLARAGHELEVFSMEDLSPRLAAAGLSVTCHVAGDAKTADRSPTRTSDFAERLARPAFAKAWYRYVLVSQVAAQVAMLRDVVRAFRPDVIATDPLAYAGAIAGEQHGIPWAAISSSLVAIRPRGFRCDYIDHLEALAPERDRMCAAAGVTLRFASGEAVSPSLNTVFATAALDVGETEHSHAIRVGPSSVLGSRGDETEFPWHRLRADRPLLYAAFGSQLAPPASAFQAIAEGVDPEVADLVLAFSDADVLPALPDHAIVVRWAPQRQLLQRAAAMVTHGGANSFSECLTAGKPMLVVPIGHEQPVQAELAVRCGAGRALAPAQLTAARMRALAGELLEDGPLRSRAADLGRSYAAADGAKQAAELLVEVGA